MIVYRCSLENWGDIPEKIIYIYQLQIACPSFPPAFSDLILVLAVSGPRWFSVVRAGLLGLLWFFGVLPHDSVALFFYFPPLSVGLTTSSALAYEVRFRVFPLGMQHHPCGSVE